MKTAREVAEQLVREHSNGDTDTAVIALTAALEQDRLDTVEALLEFCARQGANCADPGCADVDCEEKRENVSAWLRSLKAAPLSDLLGSPKGGQGRG